MTQTVPREDWQAEMLADLMKTMNSHCSKCWRADHPPPADSAIYLMDDYKHDLRYVLRHESDIMRLAMECGYDGTANDLFYAAHREAYALSGEDADLARMIRHVTVADGA
jgi:hypothetical protein